MNKIDFRHAPRNPNYRGPLVIRAPIPEGAIVIANVADKERRELGVGEDVR